MGKSTEKKREIERRAELVTRPRRNSKTSLDPNGSEDECLIRVQGEKETCEAQMMEVSSFYASQLLKIEYEKQVIQGLHMVSATRCPAWSDQLKRWSESRAAAPKGRCPVGHRGEFPYVLRRHISGFKGNFP